MSDKTCRFSVAESALFTDERLCWNVCDGAHISTKSHWRLVHLTRVFFQLVVVVNLSFGIKAWVLYHAVGVDYSCIGGNALWEVTGIGRSWGIFVFFPDRVVSPGWTTFQGYTVEDSVHYGKQVALVASEADHDHSEEIMVYV